MKTIISGPRDGVCYADIVAAANSCGWHISEVVTNCDRGVGRLAESYAVAHGLRLARFPLDWRNHGEPVKYSNERMAMYAAALIALVSPDDFTTRNMVSVAAELRMRVFAYPLDYRPSPCYPQVHVSPLLTDRR